MFIELTDHLRCLAGHAEAYLVLLPERMEGRSVQAGHLGCPVCGWSTDFHDGAVDFGGGRPGDASSRLTVEAVEALLGLSGPGGFVALLGSAAGLADALAPVLAGIGLVAVNPPGSMLGRPAISRLFGHDLPLKTSSMRGIVLGADLAADPAWVRSAVRAVLPGLRIVGEGNAPDLPEMTVLGSAEGVWVAKKGR